MNLSFPSCSDKEAGQIGILCGRIELPMCCFSPIADKAEEILCRKLGGAHRLSAARREVPRFVSLSASEAVG